ncbi:MAG: hypothetical protein H6704_08015 [Myxococcales bacterium]|nr:hypothetical protein [Myxococcales bacterium]
MAIITPSLLAVGTLLAAPAPPPCPKQVVEKGALRLTTHWHARLAKCSLSVGPRDLVAPSRSLTVASDGRVMVFNTFRPVDETGAEVPPEDPRHGDFNTLTQVTGARVFWLFPRVGPLGARVKDGVARIWLANGAELDFGVEDGALRAARGVELALDPTVRRDNGGGATLRAADGLVLDLGFRLGNDPALEPHRQATLTDGKGRRCTLPVAALFRYADDEPIFRFADDAAFATFLKGVKRRAPDAACRALDLSSLEPPVVAKGADGVGEAWTPEGAVAPR